MRDCSRKGVMAIYMSSDRSDENNFNLQARMEQGSYKVTMINTLNGKHNTEIIENSEEWINIPIHFKEDVAILVEKQKNIAR